MYHQICFLKIYFNIILQPILRSPKVCLYCDNCLLIPGTVLFGSREVTNIIFYEGKQHFPTFMIPRQCPFVLLAEKGKISAED
jgi:hypothetical protein